LCRQYADVVSCTNVKRLYDAIDVIVHTKMDNLNGQKQKKQKLPGFLTVLQSICSNYPFLVLLRTQEKTREHFVDFFDQVQYNPFDVLFLSDRHDGEKYHRWRQLEAHGSQLKAFLLVQLCLLPEAERPTTLSWTMKMDIRQLMTILPRLLLVFIQLCALYGKKSLVMDGITAYQKIAYCTTCSSSTTTRKLSSTLIWKKIQTIEEKEDSLEQTQELELVIQPIKPSQGRGIFVVVSNTNTNTNQIDLFKHVHAPLEKPLKMQMTVGKEKEHLLHVFVAFDSSTQEEQMNKYQIDLKTRKILQVELQAQTCLVEKKT
jgi:hypothetical protein